MSAGLGAAAVTDESDQPDLPRATKGSTPALGLASAFPSADSDGDKDARASPSHGKANEPHVEPAAGAAAGGNSDDEEEEEDYMNFALPPSPPASHVKGESSLQRAARRKREAEARARPKSKAELAKEDDLRREEALLTKIDQSNRGYKMMARLGFKEGQALGPQRADGEATHEGRRAARLAGDGHGAGSGNGNADSRGNSNGNGDGDSGNGDGRLREPLAVDFKMGREGIGMANEKKRKFRAEVEARAAGEKRAREEAGDYRVRQALEQDERRCEGLLAGAQKVAIGLVDDNRAGEGEDEEKEEEEDSRPLRAINVLWRGLIRERRERERERRMRVDLTNSLSRRPGYEADADEDAQDELAYGGKKEDPKGRIEQVLESELDEEDEEDEELVDFQAQSAKDRLGRVVEYLRSRWLYCFWCKMRYASIDALRDECPGIDEDDHD